MQANHWPWYRLLARPYAELQATSGLPSKWFAKCYKVGALLIFPPSFWSWYLILLLRIWFLIEHGHVHPQSNEAIISIISIFGLFGDNCFRNFLRMRKGSLENRPLCRTHKCTIATRVILIQSVETIFKIVFGNCNNWWISIVCQVTSEGLRATLSRLRLRRLNLAGLCGKAVSGMGTPCEHVVIVDMPQDHSRKVMNNYAALLVVSEVEMSV